MKHKRAQIPCRLPCHSVRCPVLQVLSRTLASRGLSHVQSVWMYSMNTVTGTDLVEEEHAGSQLGSQAEAGAHNAHALAYPLGCHCAGRYCQERRTTLCRCRLCEQRLARACTRVVSLSLFTCHCTCPSRQSVVQQSGFAIHILLDFFEADHQGDCFTCDGACSTKHRRLQLVE